MKYTNEKFIMAAAREWFKDIPNAALSNQAPSQDFPKGGVQSRVLKYGPRITEWNVIYEAEGGYENL